MSMIIDFENLESTVDQLTETVKAFRTYCKKVDEDKHDDIIQETPEMEDLFDSLADLEYTYELLTMTTREQLKAA